MPRAALIRTLLLAAATVSTAAAVARADGGNPHVDPATVLGGCRACHRGHGESRSPMLPTAQGAVCLGCHGTQADRDRQVALGTLAGHARPRLLGSVLSLPHTHEVSGTAYSRHEASTVTCTSCHSPHRGLPRPDLDPGPGGVKLPAPNDPTRFEYELCQSCHGARGATTASLTDISRLFSPENRSYHPVEAPAVESSPSIIPGLAGAEINCTDCHGNADPQGPRGPHGSAVPFILKANYATSDGGMESADTYALCYGCHQREILLKSSAFPDHGRHIVGSRASCATCHNPHGSVENRALIRFGEETLVAGVSPSTSASILAFVSEGPGSGACYLTCHGVDHGPKTYGVLDLWSGVRPRPIERKSTRPAPGSSSHW
jgi:predicted CXXCH cytochrome family protein